MKKILILIIVLVILGGIVWRFNNSKIGESDSIDLNATSTVSVPASQTVVISNKISEYKNDELGFSVKYPTLWEKEESPSGVIFIIPKEDDKEKNTVRNLQAKVDVISGKCIFPPVTTIKERDTVKFGDLSFSMISIANTLQGTNYFNRMYSLQKDSTCYFFTFTAVTSSPANKGFVGTDAQKVGARNKTVVDNADTQFRDMVASFKFVVGPAGQDETLVVPKK